MDRAGFVNTLERPCKCGELFRFDSTAAIATQSAESIAKAAQQFGRDHDISVLTLSGVSFEGNLTAKPLPRLCSGVECREESSAGDHPYVSEK